VALVDQNKLQQLTFQDLSQLSLEEQQVILRFLLLLLLEFLVSPIMSVERVQVEAVIKPPRLVKAELMGHNLVVAAVAAVALTLDSIREPEEMAVLEWS
jgi:hypothetical protein